MHYKSSQKKAKFCSTFSASEMSKSFRFMEHFWLVFEWWSIFISQTKVFSLFPALYGWVPTAVWHKNTAVEIMWWEISGIQFPYSSTHYAFFSCVYMVLHKLLWSKCLGLPTATVKYDHYESMIRWDKRDTFLLGQLSYPMGSH